MILQGQEQGWLRLELIDTLWNVNTISPSVGSSGTVN